MTMPPIILHHGILSHGDWRLGPLRVSYFRGIEWAIANRGYPVVVTNVHPTAGVARRARQLKEVMLARLDAMNCPDEKVIVIAHSLGGLDARYMITHLGMASRVKALVTICTPHRGSSFADWCVEHVGNRMGGLQLMKLLRIDVQAAVDVRVKNCVEFNATTPDMAGVKYYSVSAQRPWKQIPIFGRHAHKIIAAAEGPNDGLVSVASAQWGEHLGTWSADHWLTINSPLIPRPWETARILGLWMTILDRLEEKGSSAED